MAERTADGRYVIVNGRRWRATDPTLADEVRVPLVGELMAARRAVKQALHDADADAEQQARRRVHDAKFALGERGVPWWEEGTADDPERQAATRRALGHRSDPA